LVPLRAATRGGTKQHEQTADDRAGNTENCLHVATMGVVASRCSEKRETGSADVC
jgi:hypothetical protein